MQKFNFKKFTKKSGTLIPFSLRRDIPFLTKRIFLIYGKKNFTRGDHAHHKCKQFLVPIFGKMEVEYENKIKNFRKILKIKKDYYYPLRHGVKLDLRLIIVY